MNKQRGERPEFYVRKVCLLNCTSGNLDSATGEPATIITLGSIKDASVNPLVLDMRDSRLLAVKLLVALATNHDEFARKVLDELFPSNEDGDFCWPKRITPCD